MLLHILLLLASHTASGLDLNKNACSYIDFIGNDIETTQLKCVNNSVCNRPKRTFKLSYVELPPYYFDNSNNHTQKVLFHNSSISRFTVRDCIADNDLFSIDLNSHQQGQVSIKIKHQRDNRLSLSSFVIV